MEDANLSGVADIPNLSADNLSRVPVMADWTAGQEEGARAASRRVSSVMAKLRWRLVLPAIAFSCGVVGFWAGVGVTERPEIVADAPLAKIYYALGLFIFGGMDLGTPVGGPVVARMLLWVAYFMAPALTASAVIEATLRMIAPEHRWMRRLNGHVIIAGGGRLTVLYLSRLREAGSKAQIVVVVPRDEPTLEFPPAMRVRVVSADIRTDGILEQLRIHLAHRVLLLTADDFTNLDAAQKILERAPGLDGKVVAHVGDLRFLRTMGSTSLASRCTIFNGHQISAKHLVQTHVLDHFHRTKPRDLVVLAGFGRFGETILAELQRAAAGCFSQVIIIDVEATRRAVVFEDQIGFSKDYERRIIDGDLRDPALWHSLAGACRSVGGEPVFVLGSGIDRTNLRTAMWLSETYPKALVVARSEERWSFAEEISRDAGIETFSVPELVADSMPAAWFEGG